LWLMYFIRITPQGRRNEINERWATADGQLGLSELASRERKLENLCIRVAH